MFGASVKGWRVRMGISQEKLAERANLHRTYVSAVENGTRNLSLNVMDRLANALETSVASLLKQSGLLESSATVIKTGGHHNSMVEILLVEDNPDDVEMTLHAFRKARFTNRVHVVTDGAEALDYVFCRGKHARRSDRDNPHVILLDLNLPKVDGMEVLGRIKADERTRSIPVVILTMHQDDFKIAECLELGAAIYITKPVDFQQLCQVAPRLNLDLALLEAPKPGLRSKIQTR